MPAVAVAPAHRRHDISDRVWEILELLLPGGKGKTGRPAQDNRRFINAVFWILRTGAPWRDLPPDYGWTLRILSGISEGICNTMVQSGGEFLYIGVGGR